MDFLMRVGILTLYAGFVFTILGIATGVFLIVKNYRNKEEVKRIGQLLALILINIPIGVGIALVSFSIETAYTVEIYNATEAKIGNICIEGGGIEENIRVIIPRGTVRRTFWIKHDGTLVCKYRKGNADQTVTISGYVTNSMGGKEKITIE
jgi:hypothetical protein